jgi:hypothetical protein
VSRQRVGPLELGQLREELSDRDQAIIRQVGELRLMSARQIEAVHFGPERHASQVTATRTCRRTLERLVNHQLLVRLERRIGGMRSGSASYIYSLTPAGQRVVELDGPRRRLAEPSGRFVDHTLAIGQLAVDLTLAARQGRCDLLAIEAEPTCWRSLASVGGRQSLRPDLFVVVGVGEYEHRWFVEIDRGEEHFPVLLRKCRIYDAYYRSGTEQTKYGVSPRTCWVVPNEYRASRLQKAIRAARELTERLFTVTINEAVVDVLTGGTA